MLKQGAWNRYTQWARFDMYGCLQVSGIHVALTHLKTVVVIDRTDSVNTILKLPNGQNAYAEELTFNGNPITAFTERALDVKTNVFCSTGQILPDGTLLSIGGASDANTAAPLLVGAASVRSFVPCPAGQTCDFSLTANMTSKRWYPTAQKMPDGRVLIVGGADTFGNIAINTRDKNNPTVEYFPRRAGEGNYYVDFLTRTLFFNLYPFVHLLPSGLVFMFAAQSWTLFDPATNQEIPGTYPDLDKVDEITGAPWFRSYPVSGASAMFPLTPSNGYKAEVMICGGNSNKAVMIPGNGTQSDLNGKLNADFRCWRIYPEDVNPTWVNETMCNWPTCNINYRRVMGDMVLLADGSVLILNGAAQGFQGLKQAYANAAQTQPLLYFPSDHTWYPTARLPQSAVFRMYHSSALLLHDASVLVTGSNPNPSLIKTGGYASEFRVEKFIPPYLLTGRTQPEILQAPGVVPINSQFQVTFNAAQPSEVPLLQRFSFTLADPGFSTHNQRHGMRNVNLVVAGITLSFGFTYTAVLTAPPTLNHAPPGMYWLHMLDNGVPGLEASSVNITASAVTVSAALGVGSS